MADSVIDLARRFREALLKQDEAALGSLVKAYQLLYMRLKDKIDLFLAALEKMDNPSATQVARLARYHDLMKAVEKELDSYAAYVRVEISNAAQDAITQAVKDTELYLKALGLSTPQVLPTGAIQNMLGFLQPDGPLFERLELFSKTHASKLADLLMEGVGLGYNPRKVAKLIENVLGGGLSDALRMTRTAQLYSYREATRANYIANDDVVQGWIWWAELDSDVCMSCVAQHGSLHGLDETLDDHHNGRCAMLPYLGDNPAEQSGKEWFDKLPEATQRQMMGNDKWQAWKDGKFDLDKLSGTRLDPVYGQMRIETPLKELLEM